MTILTYNTAQRILYVAAENAGLLERGQDLNADDESMYLGRLNDLINTWQIEGIKLFLLEDISIAAPILQYGVNLYTFGPTGTTVMPRPLEVVDSYFQDINGIRRPLIPVSRNEWDRLSVIQNVGAVNQYFVDPQLSVMNIWLWNAPDTWTVQGTVHFVFRTQVTNFVAITDQSVFPIEWFNALIWGLAAEICSGQPDSIVTRCETKAAQFKFTLEGWDTEKSGTQMQPDSQGGYQGSRFV